jgi:hypothetical protein
LRQPKHWTGEIKRGFINAGSVDIVRPIQEVYKMQAGWGYHFSLFASVSRVHITMQASNTRAASSCRLDEQLHKTVLLLTHIAKAFFTFKNQRFHGTRVNVISFTRVWKVLPSLRRISRSAQTLNSVMWRSLVPHCTHSGQ